MVLGEITIRELRKKLEIVQKEKDGIQLNVDKFEHASKSLNKLIECQIVDNCKKGLGYENYNAVPPPYTGNFMPPTPNLSFIGLDEFVNEPVVENCKAMSSEEEPKVVRKYDDAPSIEEWVSDDEEEKCQSTNGFTGSNGGYVAFGRNPKGGKITEKGTIKTGNLDFENVLQLRVPRKNNMYSVDLKNIFHKRSLTCLFEKATSDESKLWHRSRFTWVFFLATKDETSGILKSFITGIENLVDHKGILRQFSIARTPQQNRVAERRNRTLIKAAKTMLADSKLPTTFWAEAVNIACYVQNRVLVVKPHNKTPYELFHARAPTLSFMRPFGCPVIILNTIDHLGKFDGKADEGTKASDNAGQARKEIEPVKDYILLPLWTADPPYSQDPKSSHDDGSKPLSDDGKKVDEDPRKDSECKDQEKEYNVNSTNNVNTISSTVNAAGINEVNAIGGKISIELPFDLNMPSLEDDSIFDFSRDDEDDGAVADMNNLDTTIQVSPNPTTRIHKDHPLDQVIRDLQSATQTRKMSKNLEEHGFDEPKKVYVCQPPSIEDQTFLIEYTRLKKHCMDYIKLLELVYVDDIIFGSTKKELCNAFEKLMHEKFQMSSMGELTFFLGLQVKQKKDGIFINQDIYVDEILRKFRFTEVKTTSTPMETQKPLLKDEDGEEVDVHMYRSMIGSLMYLTSSRPDIMFAVCACARYQVNPKVSHLHVVKRIFRYLKGQPKLGLWYLKDSPFDLVAYTDSDYAGASLDRKSTIRGCQFLGCRLISWQCKKQTIVANSTTEAEYKA
ncbi:uncharacterized mitochondrial protein-like protein [Tanacetum coccineum]